MSSINDAELQQLREHYDRCVELSLEWGLKPFDIDFHVVPADKMYEVASYGIPGHFSHWTYGRDYWRQKTSFDYGRSKIYELIINSNPSQAFLLDINSTLENEVVIAHCMGHSSYFSQNAYFAHTNRSMPLSAAAFADRVYEYEVKYGRYVVEEFIDDVMTIREHIDPHLLTKKKTREYDTAYQTHPFMDLFPEDEELQSVERLVEELNKESKFPYQPERDLLAFIADYGRLHDWQRDIIRSMRDEMLYFLPQMLTKISNEAWATVMHRKLMHEIDPALDPGGLEFAHMHSGVVASHPGSLNPYLLGSKIYDKIIKEHGWERILEVVEVESDESLLRNYLDEEICEELDLFAYAFNGGEKQWEVTNKDWEEVRDILVASKSNAGIPYITVIDGDYRRSGALYLDHEYDGRELLENYTRKTLEAVERLWGKSVWLKTKQGEKNVVYCCAEGKVEKLEL